MVLIAATASAFALFRTMQIDYLAGRRQLLSALIVQHVAETMIPFLTMWSLALAGLRLRQPRPPFRKLARQPGMIACCAAMLTLVIEVLGIILGELILPPNAVILRTDSPLPQPVAPRQYPPQHSRDGRAPGKRGWCGSRGVVDPRAGRHVAFRAELDRTDSGGAWG